MDFNKLIARAKAMLVSPKTEWPVVSQEPATAAGIYTGYVLILAAIPAVLGFLKMSVIGSGGFGFSYHVGLGFGITTMVVSYAMSILGVFILALIVDALAPNFGGEKNSLQALKTVAYAYTAAWIAGLGQILPFLGFLIALAGGIYSIYLLYLGLPHTMKSPPDKAGGYTAVIVLVAIVVYFVIGLVVGGVTAGGMLMSGGFSRMAGGSSSSSSGEVTFDKDSSMGKLQDWSKRMEKAGKQMEAAQKSGDAKAQNDALKQVMGAALGGGDVVESLPTERIKQFVPEELAGLKRSDFSAERNNAMGMQMSTARGRYSADDGRSIELEVADVGTAKGVLAFAGWSGLESDKETDHGYDKTYHSGEQLIHERWDSQSKSGEYSLVVAERFTVKASGSNVDSIDVLKAAVNQVNLSGLAALKNEGVKAQQ
jgi:hypothetical protein